MNEADLSFIWGLLAGVSIAYLATSITLGRRHEKDLQDQHDKHMSGLKEISEATNSRVFMIRRRHRDF